MQIQPEEYNKAARIAEEIMKMSRNSIMVKMRFLDVALFNLKLQQKDTTYMTDGKYLYYGVEHLLERYLQDNNKISSDIMHVLLHCIFRHFYVNKNVIDQRLWNISCDVAVEQLIEELDIGTKRTVNNTIKKIKSNVKELTAEKIYRYLLYNKLSEFELKEIEEVCFIDDHSLWYIQDNLKSSQNNCDGDNDDNNQNQDNNPESNSSDNSNNDDNDSSDNQSESQNRRDLAQKWEEISKRVQVDMETASFGKLAGVGAGGMLQNLRAMNRERYDYSTFLKKFSVIGEAMKVNDDEFDYIFYTYGLKKYGNMPLIEPLEYKEVKRIKEFVIAIDTSGSVYGELVQKFLQKTYNILKQADTFFTKFNLHIIQCDAEIQESVKITTQEEFDRYLKSMTMKGFGGTDFRPVFTYVNRMISNKEFTNLKGMIYFTDGYGVFPEKKPEYNTAFVFLRNEYDNPEVPPWAIKLVLEDEEI